MDLKSGEIHYFDCHKTALELFEKGFFPVAPDDLKAIEKIPLYERKGWARNRVCPCGSGKKFKKCCWYLAQGEKPAGADQGE